MWQPVIVDSLVRVLTFILVDAGAFLIGIDPGSVAAGVPPSDPPPSHNVPINSEIAENYVECVCGNVEM